MSIVLQLLFIFFMNLLSKFLYNEVVEVLLAAVPGTILPYISLKQKKEMTRQITQIRHSFFSPFEYVILPPAELHSVTENQLTHKEHSVSSIFFNLFNIYTTGFHEVCLSNKARYILFLRLTQLFKFKSHSYLFNLQMKIVFAIRLDFLRTKANRDE